VSPVDFVFRGVFPKKTFWIDARATVMETSRGDETCVLQQFILPVPYCSLLCMLIHYHCRAFQKCQWARENVAWIAERRMLMWLEQEIRQGGEHIILYTRMPRARVLDHHLLSIVEP
jgi:hypothetical protein